METTISTVIKNVQLYFQTFDTLFSPNAIDKGTLAMLSQTEFSPDDKVLDLGCGYGAVGILAAKLIGQDKVTMCDISETAVRCSQNNAKLNQVPDIAVILSDGFENIRGNDFTVILSNPPYHTDFSVAKRFIEDGFHRLALGGRMLMVTKRLTWYKNKLASVFGGCKIHALDGYYVFIAEKRAEAIRKKDKNTNKLSKKLQRKYKK